MTPDQWLAGLPDELAGQRRIMSGLLAYCRRTPEARWLAVSCSIARGAGDALSDVDAGLGSTDAAAVDAAIAGLVPELGEVVDVLRHTYSGVPRTFAQYADGSQLDLVVLAASARPGRAPDEVVLHDPDGRLATPFTPSVDTVTGENVREWTHLGWCALVDAAKYLTRGSAWEAHARLHEARDRIWALWGAARGARYPVFGLSQVLDRDPDDLPPGIGATASDLDPERLRAAALAAADVLHAVAGLAAERYPTELPEAMADYVTGRLKALASAP